MQTADHRPLRDRLIHFMDNRLLDPHRRNSLIPDDLFPLLDSHLVGWEPVILGTYVLALLMRGASRAECARYATDRDVALPFEGCEQQLFDLLLTTLHERVGDPATVARIVELVAELNTTLSSTIKRDIGPSTIAPPPPCPAPVEAIPSQGGKRQ